MGEKTTKRLTQRDREIDGKTVRTYLDGDDVVKIEVLNELGWKIGEYSSWAMFEQVHGREGDTR